MKKNEQHILVTGSQGLIGASLILHLNSLGVKTVGIDNRATTKDEFGDICIEEDVLPKLVNCMGVIHLAGISRVAIAHKNPELCMETNHEASKRLASNAKRAGVKWFIYASSREVYGHVTQERINENHPLNPVNVYGIAKLKSEEYIDSLKSDSFNAAIVRFSNVFGSSNDHKTRVIPAFISAAQANKTLYVEGSKNSFDFTFVDEVIDAITRMYKCLDDGKNLKPMHITTGKSTSLHDLALLALEIFGSTSGVIEKTARDFDVSSFSGNPQLAFEQLGWKHEVGNLKLFLQRYAKRCKF